jgi:hypothetical protein
LFGDLEAPIIAVELGLKRASNIILKYLLDVMHVSTKISSS